MTATTTRPARRIRTLPVLLATEDDAEELGLLAPDDRLTCHVHGRWVHQCVASPLHVSSVTRHRWCRGCATELTVAVDELTQGGGDVLPPVRPRRKRGDRAADGGVPGEPGRGAGRADRGLGGHPQRDAGAAAGL